ncbi:hypothetical protein ACQ9BO_26115 [Flavobacterium sp. P21]|uniref:hypothetical protein n=1 Tax=Flavobacterium sp. P21 TaxID=3423948 RepID=UPI003D66EFB2
MEKINKNIVIVALARDCGDKLQTLIPFIEELRNQFVWSQIVVVENDSKDNTKEVLQKWKETSLNIECYISRFWHSNNSY